MSQRSRTLTPLAVCLALVLLASTNSFVLGAEGSQLPSDRPTASANTPSHHDPVAPVLAGIVVIILAARLGGHLFERMGQPAVLGELIVGVLLGNLSLLGVSLLDFLKIDYGRLTILHLQNSLHCAGITIDQLARIGVILLLFQVGLETSVADLRRVGPTALTVAILGVAVPMSLGWMTGLWLLPEKHWTVHMFLGATLCATSVGITARVLRDLGKSQSAEARIILGAAVIDDVLALIVLALSQGVIASLSTGRPEGGASQWADLVVVVVKAAVFLGTALVLGQYISRPLFKAANCLQGSGLLVVTALTFCFGMAWFADFVGLAPIVGAFAAGLILEKVQYRELADREEIRDLETLVKPLADFFVPIFFVMIGIQVDLRSFLAPGVLGLAAFLTLAAFVGKQACSLGVWSGNVDRWSIGLGMVPRGEVGIIFASIGRQLHLGERPIIDRGTYSALVLMVMVTTLITPPLLKWSLTRAERGGNPDEPANE